jgi:hypothetical protein
VRKTVKGKSWAEIRKSVDHPDQPDQPDFFFLIEPDFFFHPDVFFFNQP